MTAPDRTTPPDADRSFFRTARQPITSPPPTESWLLAIWALICSGLVIAGSLGPWMYYERVSETVPDAWTLYGVRTDGAFTLLFAVVALVALLVALFKAESADIAWVAVGALALCALTGLLGWLVFAPPETSVEPGYAGNISRVEWGMKLVGLAGAAGTIATFFLARTMNHD
jgi:hypothetical protein